MVKAFIPCLGHPWYTMKKNCFRALLIGSILVLTGSAIGQTKTTDLEFVYRNWNNQNGLPQNTVYDLLEDSMGYLWGATEEGLFRFDGARFQRFSSENIPQLQSNNFYALRRQGPYVWAASRNAVLRIYNQVDRFFDFSNRVRGGWIKCMEMDANGNLWIGTSTGFVYQIQNDSIRLLHSGNTEGFSSVEVLKHTSRGLLRGSPEGLFLKPTGANRFIPLSQFQGLAITSVATGPRGDWWVATSTRGVLYVQEDTSSATAVQGLADPFVNVVKIDEQNRLWIGFRNAGYQVMEEGILQRPLQEKYSHDGIRAFVTTRSGMVWLGTTSSGLLQLRHALIDQLPQSLNMLGPITLGIYQEPAGDTWVGTAGRGLNRISGGKVFHYTMANGLSNNLVLAATSRGDYVYIGTSGGLDRFNKKTNRFDRHYTDKDGLRSSGIVALYRDSRDRVWFSTRLGGLQYLNKKEELVHFNLPNSFRNANILGIMEDSAGNLWMGSRGAGIIRIDRDDNVTRFFSEVGFPADIVYDMYQDKEADIWMLSEKGLILYKKGKFRLLTREDGLHFNESYRILADREDYIWLSGNLGLQRIAWTELKRAKDSDESAEVNMAVRLFNEFDGMPNSEANGGFYPAGWKMADGTLWFPTIGGVAVVDPARITREKKRIGIHVQSLRVGDQRFYPGEAIELPSGVYNFEIRYTSINFTDPGQIEYSYRLKGLDNTWTEVGNRQIAYFSALPPGYYTFEVRAELYGDTSPLAQLEFYITPLFYQTAWFKVLMLAMLLLLGFGIFWYFRRQAQQRLREQQLITRAQMEGQEKERQLISAELHDSISQQLSTAKIYLDYAKANVNERDELITRSADVVYRAIQEIRSLCYSLTPVGLKDMGLREAIEDLCHSYASVGKFKANYEFRLEEDSLTEDMKFVLFRVIQEQMNNVARHAQASHVQIVLEKIPGFIQVLIRDDGRGFDPATVREGLGFANMRNRVSVYKGKVELQSTPGQGCQVTIRIPKK